MIHDIHAYIAEAVKIQKPNWTRDNRNSPILFVFLIIFSGHIFVAGSTSHNLKNWSWLPNGTGLISFLHHCRALYSTYLTPFFYYLKNHLIVPRFQFQEPSFFMQITYVYIRTWKNFNQQFALLERVIQFSFAHGGV